MLNPVHGHILIQSEHMDLKPELFFFFAALGLELRAYTFSHSTSPFLGFFLR
jgi:hypothetical protein